MMIKNPSFAIAWSMLKGHQVSTIVLLISIPLILIIKLLLIEFLPQELHLNSNKFYSMLLTIITPLMVLLFTFVEFNGSFAESAFPKYTFTHPISSFQLASIPIGLGILMTYFYYICWFIFIVGYQFEFYQYLILFCCVSGSVSWVQIMSWRYNNTPFLSITMMITIAVIVFVLFVSSWDINNQTPLVNKNLAYIGLFLLPTSGVLLAINSVLRCRTNENENKKRYLSNVRFIGFNLPKNYHSISQALFRYEWRVFGWILPMVGIFIISMLLIISNKNGLNEKSLEIMVIMSFTLIYLPSFLPAEMSKSDLSRTNGKSHGLSSFTASLPVSNFELAMAKLKLATRSIGLLHLMFLLTINLILILVGEKILMNPWTLLESRFGVFQGGLILLGVNLMYPIITWVIGGNILAWCLKGERFFIARRVVLTLFGVVVISLLGFKIYANESLIKLLIDYAPLINGLIFILIATVFYRAFKKFQYTESLIKIKHVLIVAFSLLVFELFTATYFGLITFSYPHGILILLDLMLLGILPVLISPLSVAMNRAR